jgi:hypothetical protein
VISPSEAPPTLAGKVKAPPDGQLYFGEYRDDAPWDRTVVEDIRTTAGAFPAILMWFQAWEGSPAFDRDSAEWLLDRGIVPMVTWESWKPVGGPLAARADQPDYSLRRIADGAFDDYITEYARAVKDVEGPIMLRLFHEMDGYWYPWSGRKNGNTGSDYVAAWRHVQGVFRDVGATNVSWVWSVNSTSVPDNEANSIHHYWPGKRFVDWIGISGYNWGPTHGKSSSWTAFDGVYSDRYDDLVRYGKPIALTEIASPEVGGNKAEWVRDAFAVATSDYPLIRAFIWYDRKGNGDQDWRIDSSPKTLAAFRSAIGGPSVLTAPAAMDSAVSTG